MFFNDRTVAAGISAVGGRMADLPLDTVNARGLRSHCLTNLVYNTGNLSHCIQMPSTERFILCIVMAVFASYAVATR